MQRISISTARQLLDFAAGASGGVVNVDVAEEQLKGAVAVHNMLVDQSVAYLADEVGMGKTYVALGALALFRHFQPNFRVMVLAPKGNIQDKWMKEWRNCVSRVVQVEDLRVKGLGGHPARALVKVDNLVDLVTEASNDPDRDFFVRLTSFSLPVTNADGRLAARRDQLLRALPWMKRELLEAKDKERYKKNFARAVNCALPDIDLLIVDEAHNLKAGWSEGKSAIRNTVLGCALGGMAINDEFTSQFKGYAPRAKRVLFLSATPIETDLKQLWNQLNLFGFGKPWERLKDRSLTAEEQRAEVRRLLVRRTSELRAGATRLTKNEYRREWRRGGVTTHDDTLVVPGHRQRLAVALVQKKVSELLGNGTHNHSFQVGLLASFESFLETVNSQTTRAAQVQLGEEDEDRGELFDRSREEIAASANNDRVGLDVRVLNQIARDHQREFKAELPHPKMDAIVEQLSASFKTGRKAIVFVRRVASVDELQRKLEDCYDDMLFERLMAALSTDSLRVELGAQVAKYSDVRAVERSKLRARDAFVNSGSATKETSSVDSFFAWFFRGEGPEGVRSGASLAEQIDKASGAYSTLLEDNYLAWLLGAEEHNVLQRLAEVLGRSERDVLSDVSERAGTVLGPPKKRVPRRVMYRAFQQAGLMLLRDHDGPLAGNAAILLQELFPDRPGYPMVPRTIAEAEGWLSTRTLFSELRQHPDLRAALWPAPVGKDFSDALREQEVRREFMSTMLRKGHPITDVFVLIANRLGTLRQRTRESLEEDVPDIAVALLDELRRQRDAEPDLFNSYSELASASANFELIVQLNAPRLREVALHQVPTEIGKLMRSQRPVAGMAGKVNTELVKQFRMPGYPLLLVTTDLLKEGEDLHTFCSDVYHYGIAWMPSELEQRVGRIDRVGSQTERRLLALSQSPGPEDLLQVFYPHLSDTVEVLQLKRVYQRLNSFLRMMHVGLGAPVKESAEVNVLEEGLKAHLDIAAIKAPLRSAFVVLDSMLDGADRAPIRRADIPGRMDTMEAWLLDQGIRDLRRKDGHQFVGEARFGGRVQPFTLLLRSLHGHALLRCVSPIGKKTLNGWNDAAATRIALESFARLAVEKDERYESYNVTVEGDILLGDPGLDIERLRQLLTAVTMSADRVERQLLQRDGLLSEMVAGIDKEVSVAR